MQSMKLELIPVPVSDIDAAKVFYTEKLGFVTDHDIRPDESTRILQLTPPGSACSILLGTGMPDIEMPAGSLRALHLVVDDLDACRAILTDRGVDVDAVQDAGSVRWAQLRDPDGNSWVLQEIRGGEWVEKKP